MSQSLPIATILSVLVAVGVAVASLILNIIILNSVNNISINPVTPSSNVTNDNSTCPYNPIPCPGKINNSTAYAKAAQYLLSGIDDTVDPCQDFYAFTCNKYLANVNLNGTQRLGTYDQAQTDVYSEIIASLEKVDLSNDSFSLTEKITKAAFESCKQNLGSNNNTAFTLYNEFKSLFGGVPFLGENLSNNIDFWDVSGQLEQKHAVGTLSYTIASSDYKNHLLNALYISPPGLSLPRDYYVKPQFISEVNQRVSDVNDMLTVFASALGKNFTSSDIFAAAQETVKFEVQIAMASWPDDLLRNYQQQYNPYNISSASTAYPAINWTSYMGQLFNNVSSVDKQNQFNIVVTEPSYFAWLNSVFSGNIVNSTVIANYMITQLVFDNAVFIPPMNEIAKKSKYVNYALRNGKGVTRIGGRDTVVFDVDDISLGCMDYLTAYMPYGTGYVYVKGKSNRDQVQADVKSQTDLVISNFQGMIDSLQWMDSYSKDRAHNKSDSLVKNYGWPEDLFGDFKNSTAIDNYNQDYASILNIYNKDPKNIYDIFLVLKKGMEVREFFRLLNEPAKRSNFLQSPAMVNAWYQPERNSITFPYAVWNPPYYNLDFPQAYNFAGQGGTGGHELTHGYDDEGVQFGFNGELTNCAWNKCGWMDSNSSSGFIDMAQCVVTQFSTQCCPEKTGNVHCANGETTQGENIADLGGQQAAYRAYREYIATKNNGVEEDRLPGLESYTPNQIFWITYGYSWCMKQTDANLVKQLLTNPHSPAQCRTNQVMQDIPEFGKDFGCARGSPMYPVAANRCKVWVGN